MRGPILLVTLVIAYSLVNLLTGLDLPNFSPMAALFFCSAVVFQGVARWALPWIGWAAISVTGSLMQGYSILNGTLLTGFCYLLIFGVGCLLRGEESRANPHR